MRAEHWLYTIPLRVRSLFRREQQDQELEEELRNHMEQKTAEYVAQGMTRKQRGARQCWKCAAWRNAKRSAAKRGAYTGCKT